MKTIYLIRHSSPFIEIENYEDYKNVPWAEYNKNMILSSEGEEKSKKLCIIEELNDVDEIYSSNSFRAIGTAKYIAEKNNKKIKLDDRINERELGVKYINELPDDFTEHSFKDKNYKIGNGETLNEVDIRFNYFINDILKSNNLKTIIVMHGIMLLSYLQNNCDFKVSNNKIYAKYNGKLLVNEKPKSPDVYKIVFDDNKRIADIQCIS